MKTVKGEYENGVVKLLEEVPKIMSKKVLITFFEEDEIEEKLLREASFRLPEQFLKEYISDEREDLYQEYLKKKNDKRNLISIQLQKESKLVRDESMKVLKEFERRDNQEQ